MKGHKTNWPLNFWLNNLDYTYLESSSPLNDCRYLSPVQCQAIITWIETMPTYEPGWRQAIIWTNAGILLGTNLSEIFIEI